MEQKNIIHFEGTSEEDVKEYNTLNGKYCSYKSFAGRLWATLERMEISTDYFNERHYFKALEKIEVLRKGHVNENIFIPNKKTGNYYPMQNSFGMMLDNTESSHSVYRRKRGTWGFNCDDNQHLNEQVLAPLVNLFIMLEFDLSMELAQFDKDHPDFQATKKALKGFGLTISDAKNTASQKIINSAL